MMQKPGCLNTRLLTSANRPQEAHFLCGVSAWFNNLDKAAAYVKNNSRDVFVGVGLTPDPKELGDSDKPVNKRRCPKSQIIGIPGLWANIDIKDKEPD